MSLPRFSMWLVAVLAIVLVAAQVAAQAPMKMPKEKISSAGEIVAIQQGVFHVKNIGGDEWFIRIEATPKDVEMKGEADASWLRAGMPVEFSGEFLTNMKGEPLGRAQEPITKLKVVSPRQDSQARANTPVAAAPVGISKEPTRGSFLVGTEPKEEKPENTAAYEVKGLLTSFKGPRMTVMTGPMTFTADLDPEANISVNISDYTFARVGDELEFEGWYIPGQAKYVHATSVWITAASVLSGDKRTGRRVVTADPAASKTASADPTAEQRRAITALRQKLAAAEALYGEMEFKTMIKAVEEIRAEMDELTSSESFAVMRMLEPHYDQLKTLHTLLDMEGYRMPPVNMPKTVSR